MLKLVLFLALLLLTSASIRQELFEKVDAELDKVDSTVTVGSEMLCAAAALSEGSSMYCFEGGQCQLGWLAKPKISGDDSTKECKSNKGKRQELFLTLS